MRERNKPRRVNRCVHNGSVYEHNVLSAWYHHFGGFSAVHPLLKQIDRWTAGQTTGRTDRWTDRHTDGRTHPLTKMRGGI